ncbi:cadherin-23-like [Engraulis encrasicolus]|uniref:cadherin-23-like n=1 Tax=Engraulis encrasicolus TaxID=184585 RepID=UPI002FD6A803
MCFLTHDQVILNVENGPEVDNNPPKFSLQVYTKEIYSVLPVGSPVLEVKATDPDVGETEKLQYSLVEPSTAFDIEPSSGQVYVVSDIHPGNVTLTVKATDPQGQSDTAKVEVIMTDSSNVVQISINKPSDIVLDKVQEMEKALVQALGLNVTIVSVTDSGGNTVVSFIAMDTGGNVVPFEDVKNELIENKQEVNEALQAVFGADTDFDIVDEGKKTVIGAIMGGVVGAVVAVAAIGAVVYGARQCSISQIYSSRRKSQSSLYDIINFDKKS